MDMDYETFMFEEAVQREVDIRCMGGDVAEVHGQVSFVSDRQLADLGVRATKGGSSDG